MKSFLNYLLAGLLAITVVGCGATAPSPVGQKKGGHGHDHDHHEEGPHKGTIGEWGGGKYHTEFTVDHDTQEATVYILKEDAKSQNPIKAASIMLTLKAPEVQIELVAKPLDGETDGVSSRFVGKHEALGKVTYFAGSITGEIDGTPYAGDFKELPEEGDKGHKH